MSWKVFISYLLYIFILISLSFFKKMSEKNNNILIRFFLNIFIRFLLQIYKNFIHFFFYTTCKKMQETCENHAWNNYSAKKSKNDFTFFSLHHMCIMIYIFFNTPRKFNVSLIITIFSPPRESTPSELYSATASHPITGLINLFYNVCTGQKNMFRCIYIYIYTLLTTTFPSLINNKIITWIKEIAVRKHPNVCRFLLFTTTHHPQHPRSYHRNINTSGDVFYIYEIILSHMGSGFVIVNITLSIYNS